MKREHAKMNEKKKYACQLATQTSRHNFSGGRRKPGGDGSASRRKKSERGKATHHIDMVYTGRHGGERREVEIQQGSVVCLVVERKRERVTKHSDRSFSTQSTHTQNQCMNNASYANTRAHAGYIHTAIPPNTPTLRTHQRLSTAPKPTRAI